MKTVDKYECFYFKVVKRKMGKENSDKRLFAVSDSLQQILLFPAVQFYITIFQPMFVMDALWIYFSTIFGSKHNIYQRAGKDHEKLNGLKLSSLTATRGAFWSQARSPSYRTLLMSSKRGRKLRRKLCL